MKCEVKASTTGHRCKLPAEHSIQRAEICDVHANHLNRGNPLVLIDGRELAAPTWDGGGEPDPPTVDVEGWTPPGPSKSEQGPGPQDRPALAELTAPKWNGPRLADLDAAPDLWGEPVTENAGAGAPDLDRLDREARALGIDTDAREDPGEWAGFPLADEEPTPTPSPSPPAAAVVTPTPWTPERCEFYLRILSGYVEGTGKDPLTRAEIREGGQVLSPVLQDLFGSVEGKYAALLWWCLLTFGSRYSVELLYGVRVLIARARGAAPPDRGFVTVNPHTDRDPMPEPETPREPDIPTGTGRGATPGETAWGKPAPDAEDVA